MQPVYALNDVVYSSISNTSNTCSLQHFCFDNVLRYVYTLPMKSFNLQYTSVVKRGKKPKRYTMEDGRKLFVHQCSTCHVRGELSAPRLAHPEDWKTRKKLSVDVLVQGVIEGKKHPKDERGCLLVKGGCDECDDGEIIATVKYMLQSVADPGKDYSKW